MTVARTIPFAMALLVGLALAPAGAFAQTCPGDINSIRKDCTKTLKQDYGISIMATARDVLSPRLPPRPSMGGFPAACAAIVQKAVDHWSQQDLCGWEALSNDYCSHKLGWMEKVPGTCSAGGPPPICVADHWIRAPGQAARRLLDNQAKVRDARDAELDRLMPEACGCWANEVDNEPVSSPPVLPATNVSVKPKGQIATIFGRCTGTDCPPGFSCYQNQCYRKASPAEELAAKAEEMAKDQGIDKVKDFMTDHALEALRLSPKVIFGVSNYILPMLSPVGTGSSREVYLKNIRSLAEADERAIGVLLQLSQRAQGLPSVGPNIFRDDLSRAADDMDKKFAAADASAHAILTEGQIGPRQCPDVFAAKHRGLTRQHTQVMAMVKTVIQILSKQSPPDGVGIRAGPAAGPGPTVQSPVGDTQSPVRSTEIKPKPSEEKSPNRSESWKIELPKP